MENYSNKSKAHVRIRNFAKWIAPEKETRDKIKEQSDEIRKRIKAKAEEDGLTIVDMPFSGSFAKKTGLRRHYRGDSEIEGQDIDIPFVVKKDKETEFEPLIQRFMTYAEASYPTTPREPTKKSVKLSFTETKLSYDLVPMFGTTKSHEQIIILDNGETVTTSVNKHVKFIKDRTKESSEEDGVVTFNNCIRLLKWWKEVKIKDSNGGIDEVPSFLIDLLAAKAYDTKGIQTTYPQTLSNWFNYIASITRSREPVWFNDYYKVPQIDTTAIWNVIDPVMPDNNVVKKWKNYQIDELAAWFQEASEIMNRAEVSEQWNEDSDAKEKLKQLFGKIFQSHCD